MYVSVYSCTLPICPPPPRPSLLEVFCVVRYPSLLHPMVCADLPISRPRRGGQAAEAASNEASRVLSSGSGLGRHGFVGSESLLRPFGLLASEASGGLVRRSPLGVMLG